MKVLRLTGCLLGGLATFKMASLSLHPVEEQNATENTRSKGRLGPSNSLNSVNPGLGTEPRDMNASPEAIPLNPVVLEIKCHHMNFKGHIQTTAGKTPKINDKYVCTMFS